jgi:hypothetical protein
MSRSFAAGDRVVFTGFGRKHGSVIRPAKSSVLVRFDGSDKFERTPINALRFETSEDVKRRDREVAMAAWRASEPKHIVVHVSRTYGGEEILVAMSCARTPCEMRDAAHELMQLADWFDAKPKVRP